MARLRDPLPVAALANHGCVWRKRALAALEQAGLRYRIAYTCDHCAGQDAAMRSDLAVAPFPLGLVHPPLRRLDPATLPALGDWQVLMVRRAGLDRIGEALATQVAQACRQLRA